MARFRGTRPAENPSVLRLGGFTQTASPCRAFYSEKRKQSRPPPDGCGGPLPMRLKAPARDACHAVALAEAGRCYPCDARHACNRRSGHTGATDEHGFTRIERVPQKSVFDPCPSVAKQSAAGEREDRPIQS